MSMKNSGSQTENKQITMIRGLETQSFEVGEPEGEAQSKVRRSLLSKDMTLAEMNTKYYGGEHGTLVRKLKEAVAKYDQTPAMAYREIEKFEKEEIEGEGGKKKMWEFIHLKERQTISYTEMWGKMMAFGRGLKTMGVNAGDRIGLYEDTRYEWLVSCYGIWSIGGTGVTVYANLGEDALIYAVKEAELPVIIMNGKAVKNLIKLSQENGFPMPKVIYTDKLPEGINVDGVDIHSFDEVVAMGKDGDEQELPADADALALIMYTSGTTGDPKGVMISHGNIYAAISGADNRIGEFLEEKDNVYVAYLPLAHILEFMVENIMLTRGALLGYGNPRTLTNTSAKPHGDLQEFKPTFFAGVPRIYDTIKKAVEGKLPPPGDLKRRVFDRAYEERKAALEKGQDTPYWNEKVFHNSRQLLGGRCRMLVSGGAPLSAKTQEFLGIVFGCAVGQGWGLTETCASGTIQRFYDTQPENIGGILDNVEIKTIDVENWKHTNPEPQGEICLRGPVITKGYYKQPEKTAEAYGEDGWFKTGDIGQFQKDGTLKIIGRSKALAKNSHGEYVAMEALETTYVLNELCMPNGVCVVVHPHRGYIACLALTDESKAMKFAKANKIEGEWPAILENEEFHTKAAASLAATAKEAGKKPFECVKGCRILNEEWTPENGVLTAAQKLKRRIVDEKYKDLIDALFVKEG